MSWKTAGKLLSGPPIASGSGANGVDRRIRPNPNGVNAYQREQEFACHYSRKGKEPEAIQGRTDWDVLKENHRFIREDEEPDEVSWEERLARAYESKLFKEFALIDLKHYKSRRLALRWRTAEEVVEGIGEETCASLRCKYHPVPSSSDSRVDFDNGSSTRRRSRKIPGLRAFELPFVYQEGGERKEALVKVKLCRRCEGKLTWKPGHEERPQSEDEEEEEDDRGLTGREDERTVSKSRARGQDGEEGYRHGSRSQREYDDGRRNSPERTSSSSGRHRDRQTSKSPPPTRRRDYQERSLSPAKRRERRLA